MSLDIIYAKSAEGGLLFKNSHTIKNASCCILERAQKPSVFDVVTDNPAQLFESVTIASES